MRILIPTIVFLLAFFNDDINYNCNTLQECLTKSIEKIDKFHSKLCECDDILNNKQHPIACYLHKIKSDFAKKTVLKQFLEKLEDILFSDDNIYLEQRHQLIIYFDNIKDKFNSDETIRAKVPKLRNKKPTSLTIKNSQKKKQLLSRGAEVSKLRISKPTSLTIKRKPMSSMKGGTLILNMDPKEIQEKIEKTHNPCFLDFV